MSYQTFEESLAGKDFYTFLEERKFNAIESGMSKDDPEARGKYQFIKEVEKHLKRVKHESKNN
jgi:hypothetical protein